MHKVVLTLTVILSVIQFLGCSFIGTKTSQSMVQTGTLLVGGVSNSVKSMPPEERKLMKIRVFSADKDKKGGLDGVNVFVQVRKQKHENSTCGDTYILMADKTGEVSFYVPKNRVVRTTLFKSGWVVDEYKTQSPWRLHSSKTSEDFTDGYEYWLKPANNERTERRLSQLMALSDELNLCRKEESSFDVIAVWDQFLYKEASSLPQQGDIESAKLAELRMRKIASSIYPDVIPDKVRFPIESLKRISAHTDGVISRASVSLEKALLEEDVKGFTSTIDSIGISNAEKHFMNSGCTLLGAVLGTEGLPFVRESFHLRGYNSVSNRGKRAKSDDYSTLISTALLGMGVKLHENYGDRGCDSRSVNRMAGSMLRKKDRTGVALLLKMGMSPNHKMSNGNPIVYGAALASESIAIDMLNAGADLRSVSRSGESLLSLALRTSANDLVEYYLSHDKDEVTLTEREYGALFRAAMKNKWVESYVMNRLNSYETESLDSMMSVAISNNRVDIVSTLFLHGYELNGEYFNPIVGMKVPEHRILNSVYALKRSYDTSLIDILVENGAKIDATWPVSGETAIMMAAKRRLYFPLITLLEHGADADARNKDGHTALLLISKDKLVTIPKIQNTRGRLVAHPRPSPSMLKANKAHLAEDDKFQEASYDLATSDDEIIKILLEYNADPNASSEHGRTPLMYFTQRGDIKSVAVLLERGADRDITDRYGKKATDYIGRIRAKELRQLLEG